MFKAVLFDLDGTLLDTLDDLAGAVNHALRRLGLPERTRDEVRAFVGNGAGLLGERACGGKGEASDAFGPIFRAYYQAHMEERTRPYEGALDLLDALRRRGALCAVVSNKPDGAVGPLCERYFPGRIDVAVGERDGVPRKPAPDSCLAVMRSLGVCGAECAYVGDADTDLHVAQNAGIRFIGVSWGFRGRAYLESAGAQLVVDTAEELREALLRP